MVLESVSVSVFNFLRTSWKTWAGYNVSECCRSRTYTMWALAIVVDVEFLVSEEESVEFLKKETGR